MRYNKKVFKSSKKIIVVMLEMGLNQPSLIDTSGKGYPLARHSTLIGSPRSTLM